MKSLIPRAAVLVLSASLVIAGATANTGLLTPTPASPTHPEFDPSQLVPDQLQSSSTLDPPAAPAEKTIVIDYSHQNRLTPGALDPLVSTLTAAGHRVITLEDRSEFRAALAKADAVLIADPVIAYSSAEATALAAFVDAGGRLLLLGEPHRTTVLEGILATRRARFGAIPDRLGVSFGSSALSDQRANDGNHRHILARGTAAPPTDTVDQAVLYTATTVEVRAGRALLRTNQSTQLPAKRDPGPHQVAAIRDNLLVVGDTSFLANNRYNIQDNAAFVSALAAFLVTGDRDRHVQEYPFYLSDSPVIQYTTARLLPAATTLTADLRSHGAHPTLKQPADSGPHRTTDVLITTFDYLDDHPRLAATTGIRLRNDTVRTAGIHAETPGLVVIRAPRQDYGLVIAADTPERATQAIEVLADPSTNQWAWDRAAINRRTLVFTGDPATVIGL